MFGLFFYFQPKNNQKSNFLVISGSSLHFCNWCSKFFNQIRINNIFQIRGEKTQKTARFFKNKVKFVSFRTKWSCCLIQPACTQWNHLVEKLQTCAFISNLDIIVCIYLIIIFIFQNLKQRLCEINLKCEVPICLMLYVELFIYITFWIVHPYGAVFDCWWKGVSHLVWYLALKVVKQLACHTTSDTEPQYVQ